MVRSFFPILQLPNPYVFPDHLLQKITFYPSHPSTYSLRFKPLLPGRDVDDPPRKISAPISRFCIDDLGTEPFG